ALPPGSPLDLLRLCLQKDAKLRLRDIGDAALIPAPTEVPLLRQSAVFNLHSAITVVLALALIATAALLWRNSRAQAPAPLQRFTVDLGVSSGAVNYGLGGAAILSPDGRRLLFLADGPSGRPLLYSRMLDQPNAVPLAGTENAHGPFFSPDGQWVAF